MWTHILRCLALIRGATVFAIALFLLVEASGCAVGGPSDAADGDEEVASLRDCEGLDLSVGVIDLGAKEGDHKNRVQMIERLTRSVLAEHGVQVRGGSRCRLSVVAQFEYGLACQNRAAVALLLEVKVRLRSRGAPEEESSYREIHRSRRLGLLWDDSREEWARRELAQMLRLVAWRYDGSLRGGE